MTVDLRLGRWQDVLADVKECDSLITDPPYSPRVRSGFRGGNDVRTPNQIPYGSITDDDAREMADRWAGRVGRWAVIFCDHVAWGWHEQAWKDAGWVTFAPVVWVRKTCTPRFSGDGPCSAADYVLVARRRGIADGHRRGWYLASTPRSARQDNTITGAKDPIVMRALVRDYSRPGDLVVDPYAGSGTTAMACAAEGRRCITAECDPKHYEIARKRIAAGYTVEMFQ